VLESRSAFILVKERRRREDLIRKMLEDDSFDAQRNFVLDPSPLKAGVTTRRSGKSVAAGIDYTKTAIEIPTCSMLYTGLTRDACVRILKKEVMDMLTDRYKIRTRWNGQTLTLNFTEYGSTLYMLGVDSSEKEREKALGNKYARIYVDESASYSLDQRQLVYKIFKPAVADYRGQIAMIGTPGDNVFSLFFDVTNGKEPGWSTHRWSALDNPYMKDKWLAEIAELKKNHPNIEQTAWFRQMYLGLWVIDESKLVYKYKEERDLIDLLPVLEYRTQTWHHVCGLDLGHSPDPSAFTVCAYRDYDPNLYIVKSYKRTEMDITDVAALWRHLNSTYHFEKTIVDNANKQAVEELKQRFQIPLEPADKAGKSDFIAILNDDFAQGKIKLLRSETEPLQEELKTLVWDERLLVKGKREELASCKNDCCDSFLYPWRYCYNWVDRGTPTTPRLTEEQEVDEFWESESEEGQRRKNAPFWER